MDGLVEALKAKQEEMGLSLNGFARYLGINAPQLSRIYRGIVPLRVNKNVGRILCKFPEMAPLFMPQDSVVVTSETLERQEA